MQGARGHTGGGQGAHGRGRLHQRLDLELRQAKQAEARLRQHLQGLQQTHLHQLRALSWEQRQLQGRLQRLQLDTVKKRSSSCLGNGIRNRAGDTPPRPPQGGRPGAPAARAQATMTQKMHRAGSQGPPPLHPGLQDPANSKEPSVSQGRASPQAPEERPADQAAPTDAPEPGPGPAGDPGEAQGDEARSEDLQPGLCGGEHASPRAPASAAASFLELSAKAADAHYLRHRAPPEFERLLSIAEIFGHGDPAAQSGAAPPL